MFKLLRFEEIDPPPEGTGEFLYRYEDVHYSRGVDMRDNPLPGGHVRVELREYPIMRRTPKGAWIRECWTWSASIPLPGQESRQDRGERFVLLNARKRFAAETKEDALVDYKARKRKQIKILKARLRAAEVALMSAECPTKEGYY
jgi:hypothetical protein